MYIGKVMKEILQIITQYINVRVAYYLKNIRIGSLQSIYNALRIKLFSR